MRNSLSRLMDSTAPDVIKDPGFSVSDLLSLILGYPNIGLSLWSQEYYQ